MKLEDIINGEGTIDDRSGFKADNSKIYFIYGSWGVGKTYIYKTRIQPWLVNSKQNPVYISLFGIKNKEEIRNKIVDNYINRNIKSIKPWVLLFLLLFVLYFFFTLIKAKCCILSLSLFNFSLFTVIVLSVLYILRRLFKSEIYQFGEFISGIFANKYFLTGENIYQVGIHYLFNCKTDIFIFDDLERVSNNITNIDEILGFINDLRETHHFNIILIGNEEELNRRFKDFEFSKEKCLFKEVPIRLNRQRLTNIIDKTENDELKDIKRAMLLPLCPVSTKQAFINKGTTENCRIFDKFMEIIDYAYNILISNSYGGDFYKVIYEYLYEDFCRYVSFQNYLKDKHSEMEYVHLLNKYGQSDEIEMNKTLAKRIFTFNEKDFLSFVNRTKKV